ncbi:MAG: ATP-binding protein [Stenotrophomonas sp.]
MNRPLNPFDPSHPIAPSRFVGRAKEIGELVAALQHAKNGRPRHFLITGDRGAGKTSFLDYSRKTAADRTQGFNFLVVDFAVDRHTTRLDLARTLHEELSKILSLHAPLKDMLGRAWGFIQKFEVAGVSFRADEPVPQNHRDICRNVADSLRDVVDLVCIDIPTGEQRLGYDGILLLVDELDQASEELDIGTFFKLLLERLNSIGCHQVVVGVAGLASSTDVLVKSHKSSLRIFDELALDGLKKDDVAELLALAELSVRGSGSENFCFMSDAKDAILQFSGGHAHFVHQFGYCAFEKACLAESADYSVHAVHVWDGAFERRGALDLIGDMYFQDAYHEIECDEVALSVLDHLCENPGERALVIRLCAELHMENHLVQIAATRLVELGFLNVDKEDGSFGVKHACFAYWLKAKRPRS